MDRILALLFISCTLLAGATGVGKAQPSIAGPGQNENGKGSVSGRVVREDGEPAVGMVVFVYYGRRGAHPNMSVQTDLILTDKAGRFHVPDLLAGQYVISVMRPCCRGPNEDSIPPDDADDAPYYKEEVTYYRDTLDRKDAAAVWVKANAETAGVDITVRRPPLHKVSGTVFNRDGQPLSGADVRITRKQKPDTGPHSAGVSTFADAQGNWSLDVPDGVYLIQASNVIVTFEGGKTAPYQGPPLPNLLPRPNSVSSNDPALPRQVSVSGADVPNVMIDMNRREQVLSGRVVLEDGRPILEEATIDVAISADYNYKTIAADGGFELKGPSLGDQFLSVICQPFGAYYVKSITWDGIDFLRTPFEFGNGVDYKGVEVVLSSRGALVEGKVGVNGGTSPVTRGQVWLIPEDETKWRAPLTWVSSRIYEDGAFTMYAAPGDYLIIIDESGNRGFGPYDLDAAEDYVRERATKAPRVTLKAGERKSVSLRKRR